MILHLARRDWLEQVRHRGILLIALGLLGLVSVLTLVALGLLSLLNTPDQLATLGRLTEGEPNAFLDTAARGCLMAFDFLLYSQYLGFVGVIAGHSLLHDRQTYTLPFLLLAPVSRSTLLLGKVLGALGPLTALTVLLGSATGLVLANLPLTAPYAALSGRTASWWVALWVAGPSWGAFVAMATVVTSSRARDVRLAQQAVWFIVFFVQLLVAFLITGSLESLWAQGLAGLLGLAATGLALWVGTSVLARDLER